VSASSSHVEPHHPPTLPPSAADQRTSSLRWEQQMPTTTPPWLSRCPYAYASTQTCATPARSPRGGSASRSQARLGQEEQHASAGAYAAPRAPRQCLAASGEETDQGRKYRKGIVAPAHCRYAAGVGGAREPARQARHPAAEAEAAPRGGRPAGARGALHRQVGGLGDRERREGRAGGEKEGGSYRPRRPSRRGELMAEKVFRWGGGGPCKASGPSRNGLGLTGQSGDDVKKNKDDDGPEQVREVRRRRGT
ncbi:unnamed protein product, partial [Prorocentrum cordatum]